ncbi:reticulon-4-interacting protein 1, mitochondrial precursor [Durotheca rogersii]|uniref:reticulon-4-interacting protein 1, mitochondrial precursor n=1 Tax=Durotheca rogersii TaxID=419775 RepID=UPI0022206098|nr:reticulon-4-interacting protein 1, mitochondrial precursor [Durotheca rogersii]KAI5865686.1 reticulon-4-interacting protein 1, mitochondrial precursor [Durotheca rogersii]
MADSSAPAKLQSMRGWIYTSTAGGLEKNLKLVENASLPFRHVLPKDAVLVQVRSCALNPADYKFPEMGLPMRAFIPTPASPGLDYAGVVAQVGNAVEGFSTGQRVFGRAGFTRYGSLGEYVLVRRNGCAAVPEGVSLEDASCVGTAGQTAYQCIVPNVKAGDKVFINGGSGGTGTFGIQIAKAVGCHVTTSCSAKNADLCRSLGADEVIDYAKENVSEILKAKGLVYKLVVDNVGNDPADLYKAADHFLLPEGKFVQVGAPASFGGMKTLVSRMNLPSFLGGGERKIEFLFTKDTHEDLVQIGEWMREGKVRAVTDEVFPYEDAPKAFEKLKTGRARGKIVVSQSSKS